MAGIDRLVCGGNFFALVYTMLKLKKMNLISKDADGNPEMIAFLWMDRDQHYFVATNSLLAKGFLLLQW